MSFQFAPVINDPKKNTESGEKAHGHGGGHGGGHALDSLLHDDVHVQLELRRLGQPATYTGEGPLERRLRLEAARHEKGQQNIHEDGRGHDGHDGRPHGHDLSDQSDESDDEFYTPGREILTSIRTQILKHSVHKASTRVARQKAQAAALDFTKMLKHRRQIAGRLQRYELQGSYTMTGNQRMLSRVRYNCTDSQVACSSWDGTFYVLQKDLTGFYTERQRLGTGFHTEMATVAWSPTDETLLVSGGAEGRLNVWRTGDSSIASGAKRVLDGSGNGKSGIGGEVGVNGAKGGNGENGGNSQNAENRETPTNRPLELAPISSVPNAHSKRIAQVGFHPSGDWYVSTGYDQVWKLWDVREPETELMEQEGHASEVYLVAFHPDGGLVATGGLDAVCLLWDLRSGRSVAAFQGHVKGIYAMDFAPNGHHLATGSGDNSVKIWDLRKGRQGGELFSIPAHTRVVSDVRFLQGPAPGVPSRLSNPVTDENDENPELLDVAGTCLITSAYDNTVKVWSSDNWVHIKTLEGHTDRVLSCDISANGEEIVSCGWDRTLRSWEYQGGDSLMR